jgi:hypothetical protein
MKRFGLSIILAAALLTDMSVPAAAHHSFAMFDQTKSLTVKGQVAKIQWQNPHTYVVLQARDAQGQPAKYLLECAGPNELMRWGWKTDTVKAGDIVTVTFYVLRDGRPGGLLYKITATNGVTYSAQ